MALRYRRSAGSSRPPWPDYRVPAAPTGQVVSRGLTRRIVQFDGDDEVIGIRPHLLRVLG
jgi:hypothetical protein